MTVSASQPRAVRNERRIIERPRLIKLLDEADARTILLLAPAGYGKTTLAHQWAKTLNGAIWLTLTSSHRDISVLATDFSACVDGVAEGASDFVASYVRARANPQNAARDVARTVAEELRRAGPQWIVIDDYHEVIQSPEAELFLEVIHAQVPARFLIASRARPAWATARLAVYGELLEVERDALAMDAAESKKILGGRSDSAAVISQSAGWPALIGLAASSHAANPPMAALPSALHDFLTDELYRSAPESLRRSLVQLALAVDLRPTTLDTLFGSDGQEIVEQATDLGFLTASADEPELHPLFREYLLGKVAGSPDGDELITAAIEAAIRRERWERAFDLILRFRRLELVEPVLDLAYRPLIRSGRLGTLASFTSSIRGTSPVAPPIVDLADAEIALRDGSFELASRIAHRARSQFALNHPLVSRASAIIGESSFVQGDLVDAEAAYKTAHEAAQTADDEAEALRGWALAAVQGERSDADLVVQRLAETKDHSALDLVRYATVELARRHFGSGFAGPLPEIEDASHVTPRVEDPRVRSSFRFFAAYVLAVGVKYREAAQLMELADEDIAAFDLDFARPHSLWNRALISLGQRRFGATERLLQLFEAAIAKRPLGYHALNGRMLRARLALQTGRSAEALQWLPICTRESAIPSIRGEYLATRALCFASQGLQSECLEAATAAEDITSAVEVRVLAAAARAITDTKDVVAAANEVWQLADQLGAWDPLVAAIRASQVLADAVAAIDELRPAIAELYEQTNDLGLARRAGLRLRSTRNPDEILSPRELEVLGLLAQGLRNRDVAEALVISESTTKVHVRHILEKLGVRTRAEAVARLGTVS